MPLQPEPEPRDKISLEQAHRERDRGRTADVPTALPGSGWLDVLARVRQQLDEDNLSIVAAGVAFYAFIAIVPTLSVGVWLYALAADASTLATHLDLLAKILPTEAMPLVREQLIRLTTGERASGLAAAMGILVAIYGSSNAMKALITGLNIAYDEKERRGFVKLTLISIGLTLTMIVGVVLTVILLGIAPAVLEHLLLPTPAEVLLKALRWPLLLGLFVAGASIAFRFGACRRQPKWRWITPGATLAAVLWVLGSGAFSFYLSRFGGYEKTYGPLGAVITFLFWLYLSAYVILLGAEVNSETERQTAQDTTAGKPKPLGERGAYAADTIGPARE